VSRHRRPDIQGVSRTLIWLAHAADSDCPLGHGVALRALGALAAAEVPRRGVLWRPGGGLEDDDLHRTIQRVAMRHLGFAKQVAVFNRSLEAIASKTTTTERLDLEGSRVEAQSISDTAHYYTGLAFGLTFADRNR
jgi:hypothetical protein